jgi:hypothetical protein
MNLSLFAQSGIVRSLQTLMRWLATNSATTDQRVVLPAQDGRQIAPEPITNSSIVAENGALSGSMKRPLRVVRVVEAGQSRSSVGRIVISGRMADVCAELDRLAACEAALS